MYALIIVIIAISLTVYMAVSTMFYGGDAMSNSGARAVASGFLMQGQQINGAHTLYKNDNAGTTVGSTGADGNEIELSALVTGKYLSSIPVPTVGTTWAVDKAYTVGAGTLKVVKSESTGAAKPISEDVCDHIIAQAGTGNETFGCDKTADNIVVWYRL